MKILRQDILDNQFVRGQFVSRTSRHARSRQTQASDPMSDLPDEEINPFQAPRAKVGDYAMDLGDPDRGGQAELIRSEHINHEVSIKTLGILYYLGAVLFALFAIGMFVVGSGAIPMPNNNPDMNPQMMQGFVLGIGVVYLALTILFGFLGYGMRALQTWARWTVVVLIVLNLLYLLVVSLVAALANPIVGVFALLRRRHPQLPGRAA